MLTPKQENRWLTGLAAHPEAGEHPGDSEGLTEAILDNGRAIVAERAARKDAPET